MPASNIDLYHMQDARNNFDATRPAPICPDANQYMGQCQNVHISTNCYYGYHGTKSMECQVISDCEMTEAPHINNLASQPPNARKRSADDGEYPRNKRPRQEGMVPPTSNCNPCLLRPTHNNPDISRCLMVHMI
ncbi:uncharacterized protein LOC113523297 isoform X2 [Galleria mellonella]|uniref:Uncharacterized protein LOC113523297 isoform X2 n=1 Tax=Galleria mellonella TaxID=7137 RepID=A0A6J1X620_GALME|nr:uncharacterized protein LOC113523297 isoform X2 [Galleria mellonella]